MPDKPSIRARMRALRNSVAPARRAAVSTQICSRLLARADIADAIAAREPIAVYLATPKEIDLASFIASAIAQGARLCAPRWNGGAYEMAHLATADFQLPVRNGKFSILEPPPSAPLVDFAQIAVWIVPGLAFDSSGARLGYGGGWYDRMLSGASHLASIIGVGYDFQMVDALPSESHDCRLTAVLT